jgi:hypothetical protein
MRIGFVCPQPLLQQQFHCVKHGQDGVQSASQRLRSITNDEALEFPTILRTRRLVIVQKMPRRSCAGARSSVLKGRDCNDQATADQKEAYCFWSGKCLSLD